MLGKNENIINVQITFEGTRKRGKDKNDA